jgi:hypothetical protein
MIKKQLFLVFIIFLFFCLEANIYEFEEYNFELPIDWHENEDYQIFVAGDDITNFSVGIEVLPNDLYFTGNNNFLKELISYLYTDVKVNYYLSEENISGKDTIIVNFSPDYIDFPVDVTQYIVISGNKIFILNYCTLSGQTIFDDDIKKILNSFVIKN